MGDVIFLCFLGHTLAFHHASHLQLVLLSDPDVLSFVSTVAGVEVETAEAGWRFQAGGGRGGVDDASGRR